MVEVEMVVVEMVEMLYELTDRIFIAIGKPMKVSRREIINVKRRLTAPLKK